jgi:GTP-binding protein
VGLGHQFLRHIERTRVIVHVLDAGSDDPVADYETVRKELEMYGSGLAQKPEVIVLNKIDLPDARSKAEKLRTSFPSETLLISGASSEGIKLHTQRLQQLLQETAPAPAPVIEARPILRPKQRDRIEVVQDGDAFKILGERAEEAALKLGESGAEGLDELQDRLRRMGLERALRRVGAKPGDRLHIGGVDLEWQG